MSERVISILHNEGIETISDLLKYTYEDLLNIRYMTKGYADQIVEHLEMRGLSLRI